MTRACERMALVARARDGDQAAIVLLLEGYRSELVASVNRRLPHYLRGQLAEDLVQDAYALLWPKVAAFQWREVEPLAGFQAWLRAFVNGKLKDWRKHVLRLRRNLP